MYNMLKLFLFCIIAGGDRIYGVRPHDRLGRGELDEESWNTFQLEVNQCLVKAKRETRDRR